MILWPFETEPKQPNVEGCAIKRHLFIFVFFSCCFPLVSGQVGADQ